MPISRTQAVRVGFGASHSLTAHPMCGKDHGHYYTVTATFAGEPPEDNWGEVLTPEKFGTVVAIVRELSMRNLNVMMPASPATPNGIANYLLERLTMHAAIKVEVHESDTDKIGIAERLQR